MSYYAFDIFTIKNIKKLPGASKKEAQWYLEDLKKYDSEISKRKYNIKALKDKTIKTLLLTDNPIPKSWQNNIDFNSIYLKNISEQPGYKNLIVNHSYDLAYKNKLKEELTNKQIKQWNVDEKADPSLLKKSLELKKIVRKPIKIEKVKPFKQEYISPNQQLIESQFTITYDENENELISNENEGLISEEIIPGSMDNQILYSDRMSYSKKEPLRKIDKICSQKYNYNLLLTEHLRKPNFTNIQSKVLADLKTKPDSPKRTSPRKKIKLNRINKNKHY